MSAEHPQLFDPSSSKNALNDFDGLNQLERQVGQAPYHAMAISSLLLLTACSSDSPATSENVFAVAKPVLGAVGAIIGLIKEIRQDASLLTNGREILFNLGAGWIGGYSAVQAIEDLTKGDYVGATTQLAVTGIMTTYMIRTSDPLGEGYDDTEEQNPQKEMDNWLIQAAAGDINALHQLRISGFDIRKKGGKQILVDLVTNEGSPLSIELENAKQRLGEEDSKGGKESEEPEDFGKGWSLPKLNR